MEHVEGWQVTQILPGLGLQVYGGADLLELTYHLQNRVQDQD